MADSATQLRRELKHLRRDEGRTLVKLLACDHLRAALGNPPEGELLDAFDGAVHDLGNDLKSLALKNAYGIGLAEPNNLTNRREVFGAQPAVDRGPDTINNWEDDKLEELVARLLSGHARQQSEDHLVAVAIDSGRIVVVAEGEARSGSSSRQSFNPSTSPFIPAFIYQLPPHHRPSRLTICGLFLDAVPTAVYAEATSDLLAFVAGDGHQTLQMVDGGIPGIDAACHVVVHYDNPVWDVFYGFTWQYLDPS